MHGMAAYDYFYTFENFIGYTGDLSSHPTLYFVSNEYYGRITTQHSNESNVGRSAPKLLKGYTFRNRMMNTSGGRELRLFERNTRLGKRHKSRNAQTECVNPNDRARVKARVLYLISVNTEVKPKDDEDSREFHTFVPL